MLVSTELSTLCHSQKIRCRKKLKAYNWESSATPYKERMLKFPKATIANFYNKRPPTLNN
jgi:hypothetical protein